MSQPTAPKAPERRWTTRELIRWMAGHFAQHQVESPRVCAEMLLAHVLDCERMRLYMEVDRVASPEELAALRMLVARAAKHEPVQYLVGHAWFFSRRFEVDRSTLIPRPSTETLVEAALTHCRERGLAAPRVLDIGTGTGCIAISIAAQLPGATAVATDLAPAAVELARRNAETHGVVERLELRVGDLWAPVTVGEAFDLICANPPYISDAEWADVPPNVRDHEPESALRGGKDGLDVIRPIVAGAASRLAEEGLLLVEVAASQEDAALELAQAAGFLAKVLRDYEGLPRVLVASVRD